MRIALSSPLIRYLWCGFPILFPFYFLRSGMPKVADVYFVGIFVLVLVLGFGLRSEVTPAVQMLLAFAGYVFVISAFWATWYAESSILTFAIYYCYNAVLFVVMVALYSAGGAAFLRATVSGVSLAVIIQVVLSPLAMNLGSFRQDLFFNNPNQLGYFGLLCGIIVSVGERYLPFGRVYFLLVQACVLYLIALSLSKAALLSYFFLVFVLLIKRPVILGILVGIGLAALPLIAGAFNLIANIQSRLSSLGVDSDDSWAYRGYDRIWNHPGHWLFGAGEGAYYRFDTVLHGELHSSWGTLFIGYGAVGVCLFGLFLLNAFRGLSLRDFFLCIPVLLYGVTHQGLRFSLFWVLLGLLCCTAVERRRSDRLVLSPRELLFGVSVGTS